MGIQSPSRSQIICVGIVMAVCCLGLFTADVWIPTEYVFAISPPPIPGSGYSQPMSYRNRKASVSLTKSDITSSSHTETKPENYRQISYDTNITLYGFPISEIKKTSVNGSILNYLPNYKNPCWFEGNTAMSGLRCLPYFIQLGVGKSGTTSLFRQLVKHPDIAEPTKKEIFYWSNPLGHANISKYLNNFKSASNTIYKSKDSSGYHHKITYANISKYLNNFKSASNTIYKSKDSSGYHHKITFEATPGYFTNQGALTSVPGNKLGDEPRYTMAHTLYSLYPDMRLIVIIRNPTDRLFSHYHHFHRRGFGSQDFHDHVLAGIQMMNHCLANRTLRSCAFDTPLNSRIRQGGRIMLHYGMYYPYAKEWLSVFPRQQMLFIKSEEFYANATRVVKEAFDFLGLAEASPSVIQSIDKEMNKYYTQEKTKDVKKESYRTKMFPKTREILDDFYRPYNEKLAELLGDDKFLFRQ